MFDETTAERRGSAEHEDIPVIALRIKEAQRLEVLRTRRYRLRDELDLILEAREYVKNRLPVNDRVTATAVLLQRDAVESAAKPNSE